MKTRLVLVASVVVGVFAVMPTAFAHTEADVIAVPAGAEATVKLKPTHGCGGSPSVEIAIRAPVEGAVAGDVEGWTATSTPGGAGKTVLEWKGGSLPADETGEFPVTFTAPETVGELLTFPAVQVCENGEELSWISGDPADEYPAPRLLILAPGSEPAAELSEVPTDAPGRNKLTEITDIDDPTTSTTTTPPGSATTDPGSDTTGSATTTVAATTTIPDDRADDDDSGPLPIVAGLAVLAAVIGGGAWLIRRRQTAD